MRTICVICGDIFMPNVHVSATPCGHVFHTSCIATWFERSKTCPQCRAPCRKNVLRLYFDQGAEELCQEDPDTLRHLLDNTNFQVKLKDQEINNLMQASVKQTNIIKELREEIGKHVDQAKSQSQLIFSLETQIQFLGGLKERMESAVKERDKTLAKLIKYQKLEELVCGVESNVRERLSHYGDSSSEDVRNLATLCELYLSQVGSLAKVKSKYSSDLDHLRREKTRKEDELRAAKKSEASLRYRLQQKDEDLHRLEELNLSLSTKLSVLEAAFISSSGDVTVCAVRRLLNENVTSQCLQTQFRENTDTQLTPEVIGGRTTNDDGVECDLDQSIDMFDEMSSEKLISKENRKKSNGAANSLLRHCQLNMTSISPNSPHLQARSSLVQPQHGKMGTPSVNRCKPLLAAGSVHTCGQHATIAYDGFGGRQTVRDIPRPRSVIIKKRKVKNSQAVKQAKIKVGAGSVQTIDNFLQIEFDE